MDKASVFERLLHLKDWCGISSLVVSSRLSRLQSLQKITEMQEFLDFMNSEGIPFCMQQYIWALNFYRQFRRLSAIL